MRLLCAPVKKSRLSNTFPPFFLSRCFLSPVRLQLRALTCPLEHTFLLSHPHLPAVTRLLGFNAAFSEHTGRAL